jgi:hypothetical protein
MGKEGIGWTRQGGEYAVEDKEKIAAQKEKGEEELTRRREA